MPLPAGFKTGSNPAGLAAEVEKLATKLGVRARIAHVEGDDLLPRLAELQAQGVELRHLDKGIPLAALDKRAPYNKPRTRS